jgi:uridine kinase
VGTASPSEVVLAAALDRAPTLGDGRLLCIDGPAGSGKSTLAARVHALRPDAVVVNTDQLLDGWDGLPGLPPLLAGLVAPLARGEASSYRRYDWEAGRYAERVPVRRAPLLVIEGVGAGTRLLAPYRTLLVWVDAPDDERLRRVVARDGEGVTPYLEGWVTAETAYFDREQVSTAADLRLDGGSAL